MIPNTNGTIGIIGGADGPTVIFMANKSNFEWINFFGLIIVVLILVPNIVYALKTKTDQKKCNCKAMCIIEQIGRYACMFLMVFNVGLFEFGFASAFSFLLYCFVNAFLLILYMILWIPYALKKTLVRALPLAIIPTLIFLLSGILLRHYLLVFSAVLFGIGHIYITCKTH